MASNVISILIQARDNASPKIGQVGTAIGGLTKTAEQNTTRMSRLNGRFLEFAGLAAGAGIATGLFTRQVRQSVDAANRYQNALTGLNSIATHFKQDADGATQAAKDLASDGLLTVTDAAKGLKNLLASGFELPQAIKLMERFKDSAAFNRQAALGFGEAIAGATEGIKNGNSILVDNAGVTKNLSVILEEAGYSSQDLMKATTDVNIRMALYNGLLKETNPMVGDAKTLAGQFAGEQAKLSAETEKTYQKIGTALQPALREMLATLRPVITNVGNWVEQNPKLASTIVLVTGGALALLVVIGALGTAISILGTAFTALGIAAAASATKTLVVWTATAVGMQARVIAAFVIMKAQSLAAAVAMAAHGAIAGAGWSKGIGTAIAKVGVLKALIAVPIIFPAIVVGAALAALDLILKKAEEVHASFDVADKQIAAERKTSSDLMKLAKRQYDAGKIDRKEFQRLVGVAANASGTPYSSGGLTLVGERGPELVSLPRGSQVTQAYRTRQAMSDGMSGGDTNITISGTIQINTPEAADAFWNRIDKTQRLAKVGMA